MGENLKAILVISIIIYLLYRAFGTAIFRSAPVVYAFMLFFVVGTTILSNDEIRDKVIEYDLAFFSNDENIIKDPDNFDFNSLEATAAGKESDSKGKL